MTRPKRKSRPQSEVASFLRAELEAERARADEYARKLAAWERLRDKVYAEIEALCAPRVRR